jgi:hypothetical protein
VMVSVQLLPALLLRVTIQGYHFAGGKVQGPQDAPLKQK